MMWCSTYPQGVPDALICIPRPIYTAIQLQVWYIVPELLLYSQMVASTNVWGTEHLVLCYGYTFLLLIKFLLLFYLLFAWTLLKTLFTLRILSPLNLSCQIHIPISLFGKGMLGTFHIWQVASKHFVALSSALTIISFNNRCI